MAAVARLVVASTGQAVDYLALGPGDHVLHFTWAASPGDADLTVRPPGGTFRDVVDGAGETVNVTSDLSIRVSGGCDYSVYVTTATSALEVVATQCDG